MSNETSHFHLEEYKSLRSEAQDLFKDYRALERNVSIACALLCAWMFDVERHKDSSIQRIGFFIPLILAVLGSIRAAGIMHAFGILHGYLLKLETLFCADSQEDAEGWEHYLEGRTNEEESIRSTGASRFAFGFWASLIVTTLVIAIVFGFGIAK